MKIKGYEIISIEINNYTSNGNTAISLICLEDNIPSPFATITVNFDEKLEKDMAYIDTNNCPWAESILTENNWGVPTGKQMASGFCIYPLYKLNLEEISKYNLTR